MIFAILMRQDCSVLRKKKVLILFIFASILFTYGYESFISCSLTVPPPFVVFTHLKDLIENGYKIFGLTEHGDGDLMKKLRRTFVALNITASVESSIVPESYFLSTYYVVLGLSQCNVTFPVVKHMEEAWKTEIAKQTRGVNCYFGKEATAENDPMLYSFSGPLKKDLVKIAGYFQESGILSMYMDFVFNGVNREKIFATAEAFELQDWKILSIFVGWAGFLGFSGMVFTIEVIWTLVVLKY